MSELHNLTIDHVHIKKKINLSMEEVIWCRSNLCFTIGRYESNTRKITRSNYIRYTTRIKENKRKKSAIKTK